MLSSVAKETGVYLFGGWISIYDADVNPEYAKGSLVVIYFCRIYTRARRKQRQTLQYAHCVRSIRYAFKKKTLANIWQKLFTLPIGKMIATHRKVHLFDIDVPGKIRFIASIRSARCIIIRSHCSLRRKAKLCLPEVTLHMSIPVSQKLPLLMPVTLYILNIV